jgi:hypothetical protein
MGGKRITELAQPKLPDIRWLAGLLEGEGYFGYDRRPKIVLQMTDQDVVARAAYILGARCVGPYQQKGIGKSNRKPLYITQTYSNRAAGWMMILYTLMGARRRGAIRHALIGWKRGKNYGACTKTT